MNGKFEDTAPKATPEIAGNMLKMAKTWLSLKLLVTIETIFHEHI